MSEADKIIESLKNSGRKVEEFYTGNKTSDKNVANIEDDIEILESIVKVHNDFLQGVNKESINEKEIRALERVLLHYKNMKFNYENLIHDISLIAESLDMQEDSTIEEIAIRISEEMYNQQQKDKRIQELEEENRKIKAQHVFTRRNEATDEEKAELYDVIEKTVDEFLEKEKTIWEQKMTTEKMSLEEAINIVDAMYQDRYKIIEENDTVYVDRLKDVKFTNLEFASVILLRGIQSLQSKLNNSIPKQVVIDKIEELMIQGNYKTFYNPNGRTHFLKEESDCKIEVLQELLEGEKNNENIKS